MANIALTGLDEALGIEYKKIERKDTVTYSNTSKYTMIRYADDFVVLCKTKEDAEQVYELLEDYLIERGITLSPEKTKITHLKDGFDFLGFNIRSYNTQQGNIVLTKPAKDRIKGLKKKIKRNIYKT